MQNVKINFINGTPIRLTGVNTPFKQAIFIGVSGFIAGVPVNNTNPVFMGITSGELPISIGTGASYTLNLPVLDTLENLWFKGTPGPTGVSGVLTTGDGVYALFL